MRRFGLIGYPLSHSFSKKYFTEKFSREYLRQCAYENYPIANIDELKGFMTNLHDIEGLNVTIPYKESVMLFLDTASDVVKETGACNCIRITDGKLQGFNTDVTGFTETFRSKLKSSHKKALVLGTGGASKAVAWSLKQLGISFQFVSRKPVAEADQLSYAELNEALIKSHEVIINTTPVGMYPETDLAPAIPYEFIDDRHYLYDLTYNPAVTKFLQLGSDRGAVICNGMDMLVIQAEESWRIWNATAKDI